MKMKFIMKKCYGGVSLQRGNQEIQITQAIDNDLFFQTSGKTSSITLDISSDSSELKAYQSFRQLIITLFGEYIIKEHYPYDLPEDFINIDNKTIIWHSDMGTNDYLKLQVTNDTINISLLKTDNDKGKSNIVRIRTNGSDYGNYYRPFITLFQSLIKSTDVSLSNKTYTYHK